MHPTSKAMRGVALAILLAALSGCSEYLDRRDTIALNAGNAVATDKVTQMVDPWPRASANKNIGFNGVRMENAIERYRTNKTYPPSGTGTTSSYGSIPSGGTGGAGIGQPSAPPPTPSP